MLKAMIQKNQDYQVILILFIAFLITELVDDALDHMLGNSLMHSLIQLILFILLFYITSKLFLGYYKRRINRLIPNDLMGILKIISDAEAKGVVVNQKEIRTRLDITKPTMKRKIDQLLSLNYVTFEREGNNKYLRITQAGNSLLK